MQQQGEILHNIHRRSGQVGGLAMPAYKFVEDILLPWMRETRHEKKPGTLRNEHYSTKALISFFADSWVSASTSKRRKIIDGAMVTTYREKRKAEGVQATTVQHELRFAVTACNYAIQEKNYNMPNPFARRTISRKDSKEHSRRVIDINGRGVWTLSDTRRLLLAAEPYVADVVRFALSTGCRLTEILQLTYDGEYRGERYDRIIGRELRFSPADQKSGFWDACHLNNEAFAILQKQQPVTVNGLLYAFTRNGEVLDKRKFNGLFRDARDKAGLPHLLFKNTRKTCGQRMLEAGASLEGVQAQLRHQSLKTTERWYVSPSIDRAQAASSMLDAS